MITEYYRKLVERVRSRLGKQERNVVMAHYSNDFPIEELKCLPCFSQEQDGVLYTWHDFQYRELAGGYEPFLDIICNVFRSQEDGAFSRCLSECGVYVPHRQVLESYYRDGLCDRRELVLMDEVAYEQQRMTQAMGKLLREAARRRPLLIVLNRFQLAGRSTLELVRELLLHPSANIGIVLGVNDRPNQDEKLIQCWDEISEALTDAGQVFHIGNSQRVRSGAAESPTVRDYRSLYRKINNTAQLLDYDQAFLLLRDMAHGVRFEGEPIPDGEKLKIYPLYARVSILRGDFATALEVIHVLSGLEIPGQENLILFAREYHLALCRMYQGKLSKSFRHAQNAEAAAERAHSPQLKLEARMLEIQTQMSGWYNLFFCLKDIQIPQALLDELEEKGYDNFLAHTYVYAFDNDPQVVANSCREGGALVYFNRGVALAQKIGNEHLLYNAQQKNVMIADTYGYYQAAVYYLLRSYQFVKDKHSLEYGRIHSALGYNFSALGKHSIAMGFYQQAIGLFLEKKLPEEIAEVCYNISLGCLMEKEYATAEQMLLHCVKAVEKLRLNSLRVCNLTKLYGLLALNCVLQQDLLGCRRYLDDCAQLLNNSGDESTTIEINHDYAKLDDENFLFWFSSGLLAQEDGKLEEAFQAFQKAEAFLELAKSNQFYAYRIFYEKHMALLQKLNRTQQYEQDRLRLEQYEHSREQVWSGISLQVQEEVRLLQAQEATTDFQQIEALLKQEAMARELRSSRRRMEFLYSWQKLIDGTGMDMETMVSNAVYSFLNQFGNDCALFIRYEAEGPRVYYNDTGVEVSRELLAVLQQAMEAHPKGFAVSKISGNFQRHRDIISFFGVQRVCSFAAVPFFKNGQLESVMLTYVLMKENWHASMESYMINKGDLAIYQLLFRELDHSISRIQAYEKIYAMNQKLSHAASTDMLTGLYNRTGLYKQLEQLMGQITQQQEPRAVGLMFIDLDNFKYYNDTFGHHVGDVILISMADVFRRVMAARGIVSRYGGDEFLIILEKTGRTEMEAFARQIYETLGKEQGFRREIAQVTGQPVEIDSAHQITCSIGIALNEKVREEKDIHELIKKADDAMYSIKKTQKGTYAFLT